MLNLNEKNQNHNNKNLKRKSLLPVLFGRRLQRHVDTIDTIEGRFTHGRSIIVESFIIDVIVGIRLVGFSTAAEAKFVCSPPLLASIPRQFVGQRCRSVKYRVGFQASTIEALLHS